MRSEKKAGPDYAGRSREGNPYEDIIDLPHYEPKNHPRMPLYKRAAQFAPFSALTGYEELVGEASRHVEFRQELSEEEIRRINEKLMVLRDSLQKEAQVRLRYFRKDERKEGGSYQEITGKVKKVDDHGRFLLMEDGLTIPFQDIAELEVTLPPVL